MINEISSSLKHFLVLCRVCANLKNFLGSTSSLGSSNSLGSSQPGKSIIVGPEETCLSVSVLCATKQINEQ